MTILNDEGKRRKGRERRKVFLKYVIKPWQAFIHSYVSGHSVTVLKGRNWDSTATI